jgi:DnaA-like protein
MNAEQAWQSALGQLQMEMPRASFDTWVRDTKAVSYQEGILTVGVRNAYAREWLESRLASTVSRLLVGVMNANIAVNFVVNEPEPLVEEEDEQDTDGGLSIEPLEMTAYENEVHSDHIVLMMGYQLRALEQGDVTPKGLSVYVGYRQAVYVEWTKQGKKSGVIKNIPHYQVLKFANMSRASFFREISGKDEIAGGLVEVIPGTIQTKPGYVSNRHLDNANRYRVHMSPRLTRKDLAVIEKILITNVSMTINKDEAKQAALNTLTKLAQSDVPSWIDMDDVQVDGYKRRSLIDVVRYVLDLKGDVPDDLIKACEKLYTKIIFAYGKLVMTHYFLQVVAPALRLSHPQMWLINAVRDRCWYDYETRTHKDFAVVRGGARTLARWVGVTEKSVNEWLRDPVFSAFVRVADMDQLDVPDSWRLSGTQIFLVSQTEPLLGELFGGQPWGKSKADLEKLRLDPRKDETQSGKIEIRSGKSETEYQKKIDSILEEMRLNLGRNETLLNNLIKPLFKPQLNRNNHQESSSTTENAWQSQVSSSPFDQTASVEVDTSNLPSAWTLEYLLKVNKVNASTKKNLLKLDVSAKALVSWLLYAVSLDPDAKGIDRPLGYALSQVMEYPEEGKTEQFDNLASLPPRTLVAMLSGQKTDIPHAWLFRDLMEEPDRFDFIRPRYHAVLPILLGERAVRFTGTAVERVVVSTRTISYQRRKGYK